MNNAISWGSMILALFLIGCKSEGAFEENGDSSGGPSILPPPPQIMSMDVLYDRGVLVPKVECSTCEKDLYQYQWTVDGRVVGSESTNALTDYDMRLDITGEDAFGQIATAYTVYRVSSAAYHIEPSWDGAFAALYTDGSVVTWGNAQSGGAPYYKDHTNKKVPVQEALSSGVKDIFSTVYAFAALKEDGTVVTWGNAQSGGAPYYYDSENYDSETSNRVDVTLSGIKTIFSNVSAFAALKEDNTVVTWGNAQSGGAPYYTDPDTSKRVDVTLSGIKTVFSTNFAFAALKEDDTVVTWGGGSGGGAPYYKDHTNKKVPVQEALSSGVKDIFSTIYAFAALKEDGTVVTWGHGSHGGAPYYTDPVTDNPVKVELRNVKTIFSTNYAFAALKKDGTVVTWGDAQQGGAPYYTDPDTSKRVDVTLSGIKTVFSTNYAFAALKEDGTVVTWGDAQGGGAPYYNDPETDNPVKVELRNVKTIFSNDSAFAALKEDGTVVTWGDAQKGGAPYYYDSETSNRVDVTLSGIKNVFSSTFAFAAIKKDGSVVTWGDAQGGGAPYYNDPETGNRVDVTLSGIKNVFPNTFAFAAIKKDGSVVTWGDGSRGGAPYREEIGIFSIPPVVIAVVETSL